MNRKILLAFLAGAALASGIVYLAVRNDPAPTPPAAAVAQASRPAVSSAAARSIDFPPEPKRTPQIHAVDLQPVQAVRHEKPSAMPRSRWEMAQLQVPAQAPLPAPYRPPQPVVEKPAASFPAPAPAPAIVAAPPMVEPRVPREPSPSSAQAPSAPAAPLAPAAPPEPQPHTVVIRPGTVLSVRIGETLAGDRNKPGDAFLATLDRPLVADGWVIAERGARMEGKVVDVDRSYLRIELVKVTTSDNQRVYIRTAPYEKQGGSSTGRQAATVGVGAVLGAAIGGIAGAGKGAGIGAGVGAAAGAGDVLLTNRPVQIPVEARVTFKVQDPVTITERLN